MDTTHRTTSQVRNGRVVRQVRIVSENADGTATVEALNGPLAGTRYSVDRTQLVGLS